MTTTAEPQIFHAVTESGADYIIDLEDGFWTYRRWQTERLWRFWVVDRDAVADVLTDVRELPDATAPEIGKAIYVSNGKPGGWRLSTHVVSVDTISRERKQELLAEVFDA